MDRFIVEEYLLDVLFFLNGWFVPLNDLIKNMTKFSLACSLEFVC